MQRIVSVAVLLFSMSSGAFAEDWWKDIKIQAVEVTIYTTTDDKDAEEPVDLKIKYGPFEAKQTVGVGEQWNDQSTRVFNLKLTPQPPASASFTLCVRKEPKGSPTGHGWHAQFEMTAIGADGARMPLGKSGEYQIGDGHEYDICTLTGRKASE